MIGYDVGADDIYTDPIYVDQVVDEFEKTKADFIDMVDPAEYFSAGRYSREARVCIADIFTRGHVPVVTGGSGLYVKALVEGVFDGSCVFD